MISFWACFLFGIFDILFCIVLYRLAFIKGYRKGALYVLNDIKDSIQKGERIHERERH